MTDKLVSKATKHLLDEDYYRIVSGKRLNLLNRPYTIIYICNMITHYENHEEYEKCEELLKVKKEVLDHEFGYLK